MIDDAELLRRYVEDRSEEAFTLLVQRHLNLVYGAAFRRTDGDAALAEDVVQQVFSRFAQNAGSLRGHTLLTGWLYVATRHAAATALRAERRRKKREQEAAFMEESSPPSDASVDWTSLRPELDAVLDTLGDRDRDAILLRFFEGRPFAEIGAAFHISEDAARMRVERALEKLRTLLARRGVGSTGAALAVVLANQAAIAAPAGLAVTVTGSALASASAVGAAGPVVAFLSIMNTSKIVAGAAGLLLVATIVATVREVYANHAAGVSLVTAQRENEALLAELRGWRERGIAAEQSTARLQASLETARATAVAPSPTPPRTLAGMGDLEALMARHPEIRQVAKDHWRAGAAGQYRLLFKELGLSAAQIEQAKDLLVQEIWGTTAGVNGERLRHSSGGNRKEAMEQLRVLLGEEGFRRYQEFDAVVAPAWQLTTQLAGSLFDTAAPLTAAQGEQMVRILSESRTDPGVKGGRPPFDWSAIMPQAEHVLSEPQLAALASYRAADEFNRAAIQHMRASSPASSRDAKADK